MPTAYQETPEERIVQTLASLDRRLQAIEARLELSSQPAIVAAGAETGAEAGAETVDEPPPARESLEFTIGRNWLPKIGVVVFTLGMIFLITLPLSVLPAALANTLGFAVAGMLLLLSRYFSRTMEQFSHYMTGAATLLLFFSVLRLHYFSENPFIADAGSVFVLLLAVAAANLFLSLRSNSVWLVTLSLAMGCAAVLAAPSAWFVFTGCTAVSAVAVLLAFRRNWPYLLPAGLVFVVFTHFLWGINNPFFTGTARFVTEPFAHFIFILLYPIIFGMASWRTSSTGENADNGQVVSALLNTTLPWGLLFGLSIIAAPEALGGLQIALAVIYLGLAQAFWIRSAARYATFFYTMAGNLALTVAIFATFSIPSAFLWLCLQSFLVISLAVWFRSRFIVVANFGIFLAILFTYLVLARQIDGILLMFGIVALLSARIMNWQKDRLELKADLLRSSYLLTALFVIPFALHHLLPGAWVSLSWAGIALAYYALSRLLSNLKYRWMAIATLLMAVMHVMIVGTTSFEPTYRILSFIVIGITLLVVSLWYLKTSSRVTMKENR